MKIKCNYEQIMRMILAFLCFGLLGSKIAKAQSVGLSTYEGTFVRSWGQHVNYNGQGTADAMYNGTSYSNFNVNNDGTTALFAPDTVSTITNTTAQSDFYLHGQSVRDSFYPPQGPANGVTTQYADSFNFTCMVVAQVDLGAVGDLSFAVTVEVNGNIVGTANATNAILQSSWPYRNVWSLDNNINLSNTVAGDVIDVYFNPYSVSGTAINPLVNENNLFANIYLADCSSGGINSSGICSVIPIPEPSTVSLAAIALFGATLRRKRIK